MFVNLKWLEGSRDVALERSSLVGVVGVVCR